MGLDEIGVLMPVKVAEGSSIKAEDSYYMVSPMWSLFGAMAHFITNRRKEKSLRSESLTISRRNCADPNELQL